MGTELDREIRKERARTRVIAIKSLANGIVNSRLLESAFEHVGCSCRGERDEMERLKHERDMLVEEVEDKYNPRINELRSVIERKDKAEHPGLDRDARTARHGFILWLLEQAQSGTPVLGIDHQKLVEQYVGAWNGGWRPDN